MSKVDKFAKGIEILSRFVRKEQTLPLIYTEEGSDRDYISITISKLNKMDWTDIIELYDSGWLKVLHHTWSFPIKREK